MSTARFEVPIPAYQKNKSFQPSAQFNRKKKSSQGVCVCEREAEGGRGNSVEISLCVGAFSLKMAVRKTHPKGDGA